MTLALVTLALALPYSSAVKDPSQKDGFRAGISNVLDKKVKCPHVVERENKMDWNSFSQKVGIEKSTSKIRGTEATTTKHHAESCKHCRENIIYGEEVSKPHVSERIKRTSKVDWKMK